MKSFILCLMAIAISLSGSAQEAKQSTDSIGKAYLTYSCTTHPQFVSNAPAKCPVCNNDMALSPKEKMKMETVKLYTCGMHPEVISTKDGKCPKCNMDLTAFKPKSKSKDH
ncbi:MAG: hypothetical protein C5B52_09850 [Bacteroidetes bacterium]|nr:MAG: hypothetical protein C5B52_09850 [Bacteroidota bacterium]